MSRIDQLTGQSANFGHSRSHSNIASKRRQNVNLQAIKIDGQRVRVSARTLKSLKRIAKVMSGELPNLKLKKAAKRAERAKQEKK